MVEEILYPALEDYQIDIMIGEGPAARSVKLDLKPFTLIGATTRAGMLTNPLRDRFGIVGRLEFYTIPELTHIVTRSAGLLGCQIETEGAIEIARRSRGTPRVANRLLRRVRDYAQVKSNGVITQKVADAALKMLDVDSAGLDVMDKKLLEAILYRFNGGPVGLDNLAASIGEAKDTIEERILELQHTKSELARQFTDASLLADEAGTGASALTEAPASIATLTKDDLLNLLG